MYKILDVREIRKDQEKYRKLDENIPIIDDSLYIVLSENNEDIGYIVARVFSKKYILERIFIKKSESAQKGEVNLKNLYFFLREPEKKTVKTDLFFFWFVFSRYVTPNALPSAFFRSCCALKFRNTNDAVVQPHARVLGQGKG